MPQAKAVVFDLGGVLVDWNPRHLYRQLFAEETAMEEFLATVCTPAWHSEADRGRPMREGVRLLSEAHPGKAEIIAAYVERWDEMFKGAIDGSVAILRDLKAAGWPLYALTNFPADKYEDFEKSFDFLDEFEGILVSGRERLIKPDPGIFTLLLKRFGLTADETIFIDDTPVNVEAAARLGFDAIRFTTPENLRQAFAARGIL